MPLTLTVKTSEGWDSKKEKFIKPIEQTICLEHSLVSLSKWESKHKKPYLKDDVNKTYEEIIDYIKCMTITQNVNEDLYTLLSPKDLEKINAYISDPMTATWFNDNTQYASQKPPVKRKREQVTSELIYYWMISYNIPKECEKWHLNRLLTLIRIFSIKESEQNGKANKMSKRDIIAQNRALNAARRQKLGSKG